MASTVFEKNLAVFNVPFKRKKSEDGLLLVSEVHQNPKGLTPQEFFALETAMRFDAQAVYFRYFQDGRESIPQIYIYDNTDGRLTDKETTIHVKVWSGCVVPMFILINETDVKIFDARDKVRIKGDKLHTTPIDTIKLSGEIVQRFTARDLATGLFWEDERYKKNFQFATSAYKDLIDGLKRVYEDFQQASELNPNVALKLLVQCLLIKYLEERDEESGYFAKTYFKNNFKCDSFCQVIATGQLLDLLDKLSNDFNGKIFEWNEESEKSERNAIRKAKVRKLADYLDGNVQNDQYVIWRLYSFSHLPVELISSVYEELLGKGKKDTVYTPEMVASTLIDECMPLKHPKKNFRIIDVSCGSGIFLVKAYKRIVQWWRYDQWKSTGVMTKPDLAIMKQLLKQSIFGTDIQGDAVRLSIFSLALALLDDLDPKTIWTKLKFENLGKENIVEKDFFKFIKENGSSEFDLVIGNPPFNPPNELNNSEYYLSLQEKYNYSCEVNVPDYNLALIFLVEAMKLVKSNGLLCLIQPSAPLLYQNDNVFKQAFFSKYNLLQVIDFTKLGDVLWGKANVATAAVFVQNCPPDERDVAHITVQRSAANLKKLFLELVHYDFHFISKDSVLNNPYIWKANSMGGGRLVTLIDSLSKVRTLGHYLDLKANAGWFHGEGFIENKKGKPVEYITGKDFLPTEAMTAEGVDLNQITPCIVKKFHRRTSEKVFTAPHILIRKVLGRKKIISCFSNKYLVFKSDILAIHAPMNEVKELKSLFESLQSNNDLYRFYILTTSSRARVNKATSIYDEDLLNLPYPEDLKSLALSKADKLLVDEVLENALSPKIDNRLEQPVDKNLLRSFSRVFLKTLNSVFKSGQKEFRLIKILDSGSYFALHFEYSQKDLDLDYQTDVELDQYVEQVFQKKGGSFGPKIQRILKYYAKDTIILVKPKQQKYWLQSLAMRDADETFADYIKSGF